LKKLCRRLLRYCKSQELATQIRALDEVAALAIEDSCVREVLATALSNSYLLPKYKETELHISSVKAVISIKENAVHELWSHYNSLADQVFMRGNHIEIQGLYTEIERYLSDPDISFLVARLLRNSAKSRDEVEAGPWRFYLQVAIRNPQVVEWDSLSILFNSRSRKTEAFVRDCADRIMQ